MNHGVSSHVTSDFSTHYYGNADDEDLIEEALVVAYKTMHQKWIKISDLDQRLLKHITDLKNKKNELVKIKSLPEASIEEIQKNEVVLNVEME